MKKTFFLSLLAVFTILFSINFTVLSVKAWDLPKFPPPEGNVPPPINEGENDQTKMGKLQVNGGIVVPKIVALNGDYLLINNGVSIAGKYFLGSNLKQNDNKLYLHDGTMNPRSLSLNQLWAKGDIYARENKLVCLQDGTNCDFQNQNLLNVLKAGANAFDYKGQTKIGGDLNIKGHYISHNSNPYLKVNSNDKWMVISGGSGWTHTAGTIVARGVASPYNPGGLEFFGADGSVRSAFFNNLNVAIGLNSPPLEKLHIGGNIRVEGSIYSNKYYDLNDKQYYVDPSDKSVLKHVTIKGQSNSCVLVDYKEGREKGRINNTYCPDFTYRVVGAQDNQGVLYNPEKPPKTGKIICCKAIEL
jgi:hypothetical protein